MRTCTSALTRLGLLAAGAAGVAALAACGSSSNGVGSAGSSSGSSQPATTTTTSATSGPTAPTSSAGGSLVGTKSGSTLAIGQTAVLQYPVTDESTVTAALQMTVDSAKKGSISDLKDFQLDAQTKQSVPYYVTVTFRNASKQKISTSGIMGVVDAYDPGGDQINPVGLIGDFPLCADDTPDTLAAGASFKDCQVYAAPPGTTLSRIEIDNFVGATETKIDWTVQ